MSERYRAAIYRVIPGMAATFLGVGLARFSYTALLPELIHQGWFNESEAAYLGAFNLIGYALGALMAVPLASRIGMMRVVVACAILVVASFVVCAWPVPFPLYLLSRFVSGACGAALMVLVPSISLMALQPEQRVRGAAFIFTGVGLGILLSATLVPLLSSVNLTLAWLGLALSGSGAVGLLWHYWPTSVAGPEPVSTSRKETNALAVLAVSVMFAYAMDAAGFIPHTLFWVDYLQRHVGVSVSASAVQWGLFGIGAMCGPFLVAWLGRGVSWHVLLVAGLTVKGLAVLIPVFTSHLFGLTLSSLLVGAMVPGMVAIVSGRMSELAGPEGHARLWGMATATFACVQGLAAAGFAWLYDSVEAGVEWMFPIGGAVLLLGAVAAECTYRMKPVDPSPALSHSE